MRHESKLNQFALVNSLLTKANIKIYKLLRLHLKTTFHIEPYTYSSSIFFGYILNKIKVEDILAILFPIAVKLLSIKLYI